MGLQRKLYEVFLCDWKIGRLMEVVDRRIHPLYPELTNEQVRSIFERFTLDILDLYRPQQNLDRFESELKSLFTLEEITALDFIDQHSDMLWAEIRSEVQRLTKGGRPEELLGLWSVFGPGKPESLVLDPVSRMEFATQLKARMAARSEQLDEANEAVYAQKRLEEAAEKVKVEVEAHRDEIRAAKKMEIEAMMSEMKAQRKVFQDKFEEGLSDQGRRR